MPPHRLHLNITGQCNLRCIHCYWNAYNQHADPPISKIDLALNYFKKFAGSLGEKGRHPLTIGGGEPTLRKDLEEIVQLADSRGFDVRLVTNGVAVDSSRAKSLAEAGLKMVQVSVDGATQAAHDAVRGHSSWIRTMQGILAFKEAGLLQVLSLVLLPGINMHEAPWLLDLAQELGVAGVKYARPIAEGQLSLNRLNVTGDYVSTFQRVLDRANFIHFKQILLFFDPLAHQLIKQHPALSSTLDGLATDLCQCDKTDLVEIDCTSGDIYYCRIRTILGNIWTDDLATLWRTHPLLEGIRSRSAIGKCTSCSSWENCRGGCPAISLARFGSLGEPDSDCTKNISYQQAEYRH